ncbi:hypothetical protein HK105_206094 [Polyrhizophydium stewartii]|uniref:Uncharacterized protein n=1 Tax=Polyrhizophydium stewartii TaxID=2732419 RepID=A0ABR4N476_9FUNG
MDALVSRCSTPPRHPRPPLPQAPRPPRPSARHHFVRAVAALAAAKLAADLPVLLANPPALVRAVDEALRLDAAVADHVLVGDPANPPHVPAPPPSSTRPPPCLLISPPTGSVRNLRPAPAISALSPAVSRLDEIIADPAAWDPAFAALADADPLRTSASADRLRALVDAVADSAARLPRPVHRLAVVSSALFAVLDGYLAAIAREHAAIRASFATIRDPGYSLDRRAAQVARRARLASSANAVLAAIALWENSPLFLELALELHDSPDSPAPSILADYSQKYSACIADLTDAIVEDICLDVRESLWQFDRRRNWLDTAEDAAAVPEEHVQPSLAEPLRVLAHYLQTASAALSLPLFRPSVLRPVTAHIDDLLWSRTVVRAQFSVHGGRQFASDLRNGFLRSLAPFHAHPSSLLPRSSDAAIILALPQEAAAEGDIDIYSLMLAAVDETEDLGALLERLGVVHLDHKDVREVIGRRIEAFGDFV